MKSIFITQSLLILSQFLSFTDGQTNYFPIFRCRASGNFTTNSTYQTNIETALASLSSATATNYGFHNTSFGQPPNTVSAYALCRGDIGSETCKNCVTNSIIFLRQNCPYNLQALIWTSNCSVSYSNNTYTSSVAARPNAKVFTRVNASNTDVFDKALRDLAENLRAEASGGNFLRKFATGDVAVRPNSSRIYALMQCSPNLSSFDCNSCLSIVFREAQSCCDGYIDVGVFFASCYVRYSNSSFYDDPPTISLPPATVSGSEAPEWSLRWYRTYGKKEDGDDLASKTEDKDSHREKRKSSKKNYFIIPVTVVGVGLLSIGLCFIVTKARRKNNTKKKETGSAFSNLLMSENQNHSANLPNAGSADLEMGSVGSLQFDLGIIKAVTEIFSVENKIGEGGFGPVYKGVLASGMEVAVKRLSKSSGQGSQEFINEVILMAKLQHRNLVRLLGFCLEADEKLLIYEYVSNRSLDYFLFNPNIHGHLDWPKRYKIIGGITRGMLYLHEDSRLRIIHRDLKSSNILLDEDMNAKISDFGLARIVGVDQTEANTNRIVGTYGYMSPEYAVHGHFSVKSDVFAFGVVILEIISGNKCSRFCNEENMEELPHFAWRKWMEGTAMELIDPTMVESFSKDEMMRCINIGLLCVQEDVDERPSMASVLNMLNNYSITLPPPTRPPHYLPKKPTSFLSSSQSVPKSADESLITEILPR